MSRIVFVLITLLAVASCKSEEPTLHGYVEGEYVYIAPTTSGKLDTLFVRRGQTVNADAPLFSLENIELKASVSLAESNVIKAQAQFDNLLKGERPAEIEVILKQLELAHATFENAKKEYDRATVLVRSNAVSSSYRDKREVEYKTAKANLDKVEAQLKVANLGARKDEIKAAKASLDGARQRLVQAEKKLKDSAPVANESAYIENTFYRQGEFVVAGRPVVSLLPPKNVKVRFFIPQDRVPKIKMGQKISVTCDGCTKPILATIRFISSQAEYTPPVIYSNESREKLVYMVEAFPDVPTEVLHPGLPVDIKVEDQ